MLHTRPHSPESRALPPGPRGFSSPYRRAAILLRDHANRIVAGQPIDRTTTEFLASLSFVADHSLMEKIRRLSAPEDTQPSRFRHAQILRGIAAELEGT